MSSKGQIVIPVGMRANIQEGEEIIIIQDENRIILKKASEVSKQMKEDLDFAKRTEKAWKEYEEGKFVSKSAEEFLAELSKI